MTTRQSEQTANLAGLMARHPLLAEAPMTVLDVGVSGGLTPMWRRFEPNLIGRGFDPVKAEVARLNGLEINSNVTFHDAWMGANDPALAAEALAKGYSRACYESFAITSAWRAIRLRRGRGDSNAPSGDAGDVSDVHTSIDRFVPANRLATVDFIKCDTDGHDYFVMKGAEATLDGSQVLGATIECQLHGSPVAHSNIFSNIDLLMKAHGFAIFDMDVQRYTRRSLPGAFCNEAPGETLSGQALWAEVVFFRDPVIEPELLKAGNAVGTPAKQLKLILLYDLFGLKDCAAEFIVFLRDRGHSLPGVDLDAMLDRLAQGNHLGSSNHASYIKTFEADPAQLFNSRVTQRLNDRPGVKSACSLSDGATVPSATRHPNAPPASSMLRSAMKKFWRGTHG